MTRAEATRLKSMLIEITNLARSADLCQEHTFYKSSSAEAMKRLHRTDADVAIWLDRLADCHARLATYRQSVMGLVS